MAPSGRPSVNIHVFNIVMYTLMLQVNEVSPSKKTLGSFHQASPCAFNHTAAGTQCTTISAVSAVASSISDPELWTTSDIDNILLQGDALHCKVLTERGWPNDQVTKEVDVDELPQTITFYNDTNSVCASIGIAEGQQYFFSHEILTKVPTLTETMQSKSMIIRLYEASYCIHKSTLTSHIYLFDSHAIDQEVAGLLRFDNADQLAGYLAHKVKGRRQQQIDCIPVHVEAIERSPSNTSASRDETTCPVNREKCLVMETETILNMITKPDGGICHKIPKARGNSVFLIDLASVSHKDLTSDNTGVYEVHSSNQKMYSCTLRGDHIEKAESVGRKCPYDYKIRRNYAYKDKKNKRMVYKVYDSKEQLLPYAIIHYIGTNFPALPHGNRPSKAYQRTFPSTIDALRESASNVAPKEAIRQVEAQKGGLLTASSQEIPRDRRQVYSLNRKRRLDGTAPKSRNTGKVDDPDIAKLQGLMNVSTDLVTDYNIYSEGGKPYVRTFTCPQNTSEMIRKFCQPTSKQKSQLGIDMTYNTGHFYTTTFTFPHPMLRNRQGINPTVFGGFMTSVRKRREDYKYLAGQLKKYCKLDALIYGTDGEAPLELGFEEIFPSAGSKPSVKLRCFDHVKSNLQNKLKECKVDMKMTKKIISSILGQESFGKRVPGLVDVKAEVFDAKYEALKEQWPEQFAKYMEEKSGGPSIKTLLQTSMSAATRTAAGLGLPAGKYDNQRTEALHNVVKDCINRQYVNQVQLIEAVSERLFDAQKNELIKAVYGKGEYELDREFKRREVPENTWNDMTSTQRDQKVKEVYGFAITKSPQKPTAQCVPLSVSPEDCGDNLSNLTESVVQKLWSNAEYLLAAGNVHELPNGSFSVSGFSNVHLVTITNKRFSCNCESFTRNRGLCEHVLAVSERKKVLGEFLMSYKPRSVAQVSTPRTSGQAPNKNVRRGQNNMRAASINLSCSVKDLNVEAPMEISEVHHNTNPFTICYFSDLKVTTRKKRRCATCGVEFVLLTQEPHDFVLLHKERWVYFKKQADGKVVKKHTINRFCDKLYCVKKDCLLERHPYFWNGLIHIPDRDEFGEYRLKKLQQQLDYAL